MTPDPLRAALQELLREIQPTGIKLIVGGGYGLVLRAQYVRASGERTLRFAIPPVRGTEDIDCFLRGEVITDASSTAAIREALDRLGYSPLMPNLQFARTITHHGRERTTRFDFLAAPVQPEDAEKVKLSDFRIRPRGFEGLHAYLTAEAFVVDEETLAVDVSDDNSGLFVHLPHAFSFLVLKLIALRDRVGETGANEGKYHALDLFAILATMTESEWHQAEHLRDRFVDHPVMIEVRGALRHLFERMDSPGTIALRDQARRQGLDIEYDDVEQCRADLQTLLAGTHRSE